jgi:hypothetical protein
VVHGRDSGFGIRDSGFGIRDSGFGIRAKAYNIVIPAKAGIHFAFASRRQIKMGSGLRRNDGSYANDGYTNDGNYANGGSEDKSQRGRTAIDGVSCCPA